MLLKHKNTLFDYELKRSNNNEGLKEGDFWINVDLTIKNDEIDLRYIRDAISYFELKELDDKLKKFRSSNNKKKENIVLIKHFDEFDLFPDGTMIQKFFFYDDVFKYYSLVYNDDELLWFINKNEEFLKEHGAKIIIKKPEEILTFIGVD